MAHTQWTQTFAGTTLVHFQDWGQSFTDAFGDVGLTLITPLTPAAGGASTTWAAVATRPTLTPQSYYEVWALPTAMTPASPIYIKVWYGTKSASQHAMSFVVGTDPAVTGVFAAMTGTHWYSSGLTGDQNYLSCDGWGMALHCGNTATASSLQSNFWFVVDRHRAVDGTPLRTGTATYSSGNNPTNNDFVLLQAQFDHAATVPTVRTVSNIAPCISPGFSTSAARIDSTGRTQICPWWGVTPNSRGLSKMIGSYNVANHPAGVTEVDVDFLDMTEEPYLAMGAPSGSSSLSASAPLTSSRDTGASIVLWWGA